MGQRISKRMPSPDGGIVPGQTANIKLPIGHRYHDLQLITNMPLEQMREIRVKVNEAVLHRYNGKQRDQMNQHYQMPAFDRSSGQGVLNIPFDRWNMKTRELEELTAINTDSPNEAGEAIRSVYVEIDISDDSNITGYQANPTLHPYATISSVKAGGQKALLHVMKHTRSSAGEGELQLSDLPFNTNTARALSACFMWPKDTNGDPVTIERITVERGLYKVLERDDMLNRFQQELGHRKPQSGVYVVDFTEKRYAANALDLQGYQDFRYTLQMAGAAQITMVSEYLGGLPD